LRTRLTATGIHVPYGITQCYLPPGRGDIPVFTLLIKAGTRFSDPGGMYNDMQRYLNAELWILVISLLKKTGL